MRRLIGVSILALSIAFSSAAHAEQWFRMNMDAPIFYGDGAPDLGENALIEFVVDGDAAATSANGRDLGNINIPITVNGIDASYTVDVAGLPSGATWNGSAIVWSPAATGTYHPTIEVYDENNVLVASQGLDLIIHLPLSASVPEAAYEATVGDALTITPTAANAIGSLQWGSTPSELPEWMDFNAATGVIDVDTSAAQSASNVVLTAVDQADMMSASTLPFSITVNAAATGYWATTLGGASGEIGRDIAVGADGSMYLIGYAGGIGQGSTDVLVAKYGVDGALAWVKTLGGTSGDTGQSIAVGADGSVYVSGYTGSAGQGSDDLLVAKFASSGSLEWKKTLGGTGYDYGQAIAVGADGSVYVTGYTSSVGNGANEFFISKYTASGSLTWKKMMGGTAAEYGYSVALGSDGAIYVTGYTYSVGAGGADLLVAKYSADGSRAWAKTLGGASSDQGNAITAGSDGSLYIAGYTNSDGAGNGDILIAKYSSSGSLTWMNTMGGADSDLAYSITAGSDGAVYVVGMTTSAGAGSIDIIVAKYGADGSLAWSKTLGGTGSDPGYSVAQSFDGSLYVMGYTNSVGEGSYDLLVARLPADGGDDMTAGALVWQDAAMTVDPNPGLYQNTPSWTNPDAGLTAGTGSTLVPADAAALISTTIKFEQQAQP